MQDNAFQKYFTFKNIIFVIISILFIIFITKIKDTAILFFASFVLACSLNPIADKLDKKIKNRSLSAGIVLIGALLTVFAVFIPLLILTGHEIKSFAEKTPQYFETIKTFLQSTPLLNKTELANIDIGSVLASAGDVTSKFLNKSINISLNVAQALIYFIASTIIIYYFIADKDEVKLAFLKLFPDEMKDKARAIVSAISRKIGGYVVAQIATMSSVGIIMTIGLLICGIEYAFLLGFLAAILDIIPVVGPAIALLICLITTYKAGALSMALVVFVFAIAQIAENNLVRPYIFGKMLNLHPLIIYFFLFITAQYLGVVGVVFAPAIAATVCVLIEELYINNIN